MNITNTEDLLKLRLSSFMSHLRSSSIFSFLHLQFLPSQIRPVILRPVVPAEDPVVGLPSPGALENLAGMSRTLSSPTVMGESDPLAIPSNSGASSWTRFRGGLVLGHRLLLLRCLTLGTSEPWWYALCFCWVPGFWLSGRKLEPSCRTGP